MKTPLSSKSLLSSSLLSFRSSSTSPSADETENKDVYLALGINMEGCKELLGMCLSDTEVARFWLNVITKIKNRGIDYFLNGGL